MFVVACSLLAVGCWSLFVGGLAVVRCVWLVVLCLLRVDCFVLLVASMSL